MPSLIEKLTKSELKLIQKLGLQSDLELLLTGFEKKELEINNNKIKKNSKNQDKLENFRLQKQNQIRRLFLDKILQNSKEPEVYTFPTIINQNPNSQTEHEATTAQISQEILIYLGTRGLELEKAKMLIVGGFCGDVLALLPAEFALEARKLVELTLENGFG